MPAGSLALYRLHARNCPHRPKGRRWTRCTCSIWVQGSLGGKWVKKSLSTRDWSVAAACTSQRELPLPEGRGLGRIRWTADGRSVALLDGASMNLIAQPLDGRPAFALTQFTSGTITDFAWSPDGTRLAIARSMTTNDIVMFKGIR